MNRPRRARFLVVHDEPEACLYLPDRAMRLPLRLPTPRFIPHDQFDELLHEGDRRSGPLLYRPTCPDCQACEAIRVPVARFAPSRSQRRVWRRNAGTVRTEFAPPTVTAQHVALYNRHKLERGLARRSEGATERDYRFFLVETCVDTRELRYYVGDDLIAVSILDFGQTAVSSVYHYFDPDHDGRSMGVFSILQEIAHCAALGIEWYYLGLYVGDCRHLRYKADYYPHQRRVRGAWREYANPDDLLGTPVPVAAP